MRNRFDRQLLRLNQEMIDMGSLCEEMITAAAKIVATRDKELMDDIVTMEEEINQKERDIERICMKLLMQQQPVANDLRVISAAMKMVSDMERIGDQACDITGIVKKDAEVLTIRENTHLDKMAKATISMVSKSIQSFIKQNLVIAHEVIEQDDIVDELFNRVKKETISLIHEDPGKGEECVAIVMIAKYFERIGDHAENFADAAKRRIDDKIELSEKAQKQLNDMMEKVVRLLHYSLDMFTNKNSEHMREILSLEDEIDQDEKKLQRAHVKRLTKNKCTPEAGMIFSDTVSGLERVADHATNIAFAIMEPPAGEEEDEEEL